jgi:FkbM family methyltransferase
MFSAEVVFVTAGAEVKSVDVANVSPDGISPGFGMFLLRGADQVAHIIHKGGWQAFERPLPEVFFEIARTCPGTIVDVGVNTGFYSFLGLSANTKNRVVGFEPDPQVHSRLLDNVRLNEQFADRLLIVKSALSDKSGTMKLYMPLKDHGLVETSSSLEKDFKDAHSGTTEVEVITLDSYFQQSQALAAPVTLMKVDVEGHEKQVFIGAEMTISKMRPWIAVELLPRSDFEWFNAFLDRHHYRDLRLRGNGAVAASRVEFDAEAWNHLLVPVERYEAAMSMLTRRGLALSQGG